MRRDAALIGGWRGVRRSAKPAKSPREPARGLWLQTAVLPSPWLS